MNQKYKKLATQIASYMQRMYAKKLITTLSGNISCRIGKKILITPSQIDKNNLKYSDIILLSIDGEIIEGKHKQSIETPLHLSIYKKRKDTKAIIHAHPFWGSLLAFTNLSFISDILEESFLMIPKIEFCNYAPMGSEELAKEVSKKIENADVLILENHGVITTGRNLPESLEKLEVLENIAHYSFLISKKIELKKLNDRAKQKIENFRNLKK